MPYKRFFPQLFTSADALQILGGACKAYIPKEFGVLVWNIYKGKKVGWEHDFHTLVSDNDLVMLQEAVLNTRFDSIFNNPERMEWVMARTYSHKTTSISTGVKTGCSVKSAAQAFYISPDVEPIVKTPKMLLATTYPVEGSDKLLLTVNIHAVNFVSYEKFNRQMAQIVEAVEKHDGPVIVAGDFNTWNGIRYHGLLEIIAKMELIELKMTRQRRPYYLTRHLDHVFYRGLEPIKGEVLYNIRSSDHFPMTVRFKIL